MTQCKNKVLISLVLFYGTIGSLKAFDSSPQPQYIFNAPVTKCRMLADGFCKVPLLIREDIAIREVEIKNTKQFFQVVKIEECSDQLLVLDASDCRNESFEFGENLTETYRQAYVIINALIIGRGNLTLGSDNSSQCVQPILVTTPNRQAMILILFFFPDSILISLNS
jgi:hypothetical protein